MANTKEIKDRIKSVRDTQKITNAMYLIASTKMRKAKSELDHTRPYFEAIKGEIKKKDGSLVGQMVSEGTTPRRLTDLIGSLCDLTSGSGDKGTPIVYIQGYFDNYTAE